MELPNGIIAVQDEKDPFLFIDNEGKKYRIDLDDKNKDKFISDYKDLNNEQLKEIYDQTKDLDYQIDRCFSATSANTWDLLRKGSKSFEGTVKCDFCNSKKNVEYLDIASGKVDWFVTGQFMQQLLDITIYFVCGDCAINLQNRFRKITKTFVEEEKRRGMFTNQGVTNEERTALMTDFFGVGKKV